MAVLSGWCKEKPKRTPPGCLPHVPTKRWVAFQLVGKTANGGQRQTNTPFGQMLFASHAAVVSHHRSLRIRQVERQTNRSCSPKSRAYTTSCVIHQISSPKHKPPTPSSKKRATRPPNLPTSRDATMPRRALRKLRSEDRNARAIGKIVPTWQAVEGTAVSMCPSVLATKAGGVEVSSARGFARCFGA